MSESLLFSELLDHVRAMIDAALERFRADLSRSTGTVPGNQLPGGGNTGSGYSPAAHAATHASGGSDPVSPASIGAVADGDSRLSDSRTPTGSAGGDLGGTYPNPSVTKLRGRTVASTAPSDGQALVYNSGASQWEPGSASGGAPAAHASSHQHGGSDEVATATPGANAIPKAGSGGTLADGWLSSAISRITSIGLSLPAIFNVSGSPLTANGTIAATLADQSANQVFAGPSSGSAATPAFRALVAADIPSLDTSKLTSGQLALARGGTGADLSATGGANQVVKQTSAGGALSVGALVAADIPSLDTSKLTSGQLALARGGTGADLSATGGANQIVRQNSAGGALTASALAAADIPSLDSSKITTGEMPRSPLTTRGDLLTRDASTHARLAIGAAGRYLRSDGTDPGWSTLLASDLTYSGLTTGQVLRATGASAAAFGALDLANNNAVTGLLSPANGGTGVNNGSFALTVPATGTAALLALAQSFTAAQTVAVAAEDAFKVAASNAGGIVGLYIKNTGGTGASTTSRFSVGRDPTEATAGFLFQYEHDTGKVLMLDRKSGGPIEITATNAAVLIGKSSGLTGAGDLDIAGNVRSDKALLIKDGISAPSATSGYATIYVDTADGDLKVKFGDGTVKTIVVDT